MKIGIWRIFLHVFGLSWILSADGQQWPVKITSACYGLTSTFLSAYCDFGRHIVVKNVFANAKPRYTNCPEESDGGFQLDPNCCICSPDDCQMEYSGMAKMKYYTECNGRQFCHPRVSWQPIGNMCSGREYLLRSNYMVLEYYCVDDPMFYSGYNNNTAITDNKISRILRPRNTTTTVRPIPFPPTTRTYPRPVSNNPRPVSSNPRPIPNNPRINTQNSHNAAISGNTNNANHTNNKNNANTDKSYPNNVANSYLNNNSGVNPQMNPNYNAWRNPIFTNLTDTPEINIWKNPYFNLSSNPNVNSDKTPNSRTNQNKTNSSQNANTNNKANESVNDNTDNGNVNNNFNPNVVPSNNISTNTTNNSNPNINPNTTTNPNPNTNNPINNPKTNANPTNANPTNANPANTNPSSTLNNNANPTNTNNANPTNTNNANPANTSTNGITDTNPNNNPTNDPNNNANPNSNTGTNGNSNTNDQVSTSITNNNLNSNNANISGNNNSNINTNPSSNNANTNTNPNSNSNTTANTTANTNGSPNNNATTNGSSNNNFNPNSNVNTNTNTNQNPFANHTNANQNDTKIITVGNPISNKFNTSDPTLSQTLNSTTNIRNTHNPNNITKPTPTERPNANDVPQFDQNNPINNQTTISNKVTSPRSPYYPPVYTTRIPNLSQRNNSNSTTNIPISHNTPPKFTNSTNVTPLFFIPNSLSGNNSFSSQTSHIQSSTNFPNISLTNQTINQNISSTLTSNTSSNVTNSPIEVAVSIVPNNPINVSIVNFPTAHKPSTHPPYMAPNASTPNSSANPIAPAQENPRNDSKPLGQKKTSRILESTSASCIVLTDCHTSIIINIIGKQKCPFHLTIENLNGDVWYPCNFDTSGVDTKSSVLLLYEDENSTDTGQAWLQFISSDHYTDVILSCHGDPQLNDTLNECLTKPSSPDTTTNPTSNVIVAGLVNWELALIGIGLMFLFTLSILCIYVMYSRKRTQRNNRDSRFRFHRNQTPSEERLYTPTNVRVRDQTAGVDFQTLPRRIEAGSLLPTIVSEGITPFTTNSRPSRNRQTSFDTRPQLPPIPQSHRYGDTGSQP